MAPIGDENEKDNDCTENNGKNLWNEILDEVQSSSSTKLPSCKSVLVLGDNESGKTTLIAKLQGNEDPKKGSGLEYTYFHVKDEYRDDQTRLGVWILDGDLHHKRLLKYSLSVDSLPHTLVMLVVSMAQPWNIMDTLQQWGEVLNTHIDRLKIPPGRRREYEEKLVREFQEYVEPEEGQTVTSAPRRGGPNPHQKGEEEKVLLPLGETTLTHNLGIPIVVVVTKSDAISTLEKEHDYREEHFDFIQQYIRKFCLNYGASLFYTSVKEDKNCDQLYKFLVHKIYGFPFTTPAFVVERDSVFVPSGWDTEKKISILYDSMNSMKPDDPYEDVIAKPTVRKQVQRDAEISAEDEQVFLMKQQTQLSKQPAPGNKIEPTGTPLRHTSAGKTPGTPRQPSTPGPNMQTPGKKMDGTKPSPGGTSEGVLANFFNSLLSKKTGAATPAKTDRTAVSRDAAAELDRMTRTKNKPSLNQSPNTTAS